MAIKNVNPVATFDIENKYTIYPNPTSSDIKIEGIDKKVAYTVYDVLGKKCLSGTLHSENVNIDLSTFQNGLYSLVIDNAVYFVVKE